MCISNTHMKEGLTEISDVSFRDFSSNRVSHWIWYAMGFVLKLIPPKK